MIEIFESHVLNYLYRSPEGVSPGSLVAYLNSIYDPDFVSTKLLPVLQDHHQQEHVYLDEMVNKWHLTPSYRSEMDRCG